MPRTGFERNEDAIWWSRAAFLPDRRPAQLRRAHTAIRLVRGARTETAALTASRLPFPQVVNDAVNGFGGFASFIFNPDPKNQYRLVTSLRRDYYQIPIDPDANSTGNQVYPSSGLHDAESEPDGYFTFSWVHTFNPNTLLTVSPFYHYNGADYKGGRQRLSCHLHPSIRTPTTWVCRRP